MSGTLANSPVVTRLPTRRAPGTEPDQPVGRLRLIGPLLAAAFGLSGLLSGFYSQRTYLLVALAVLGVMLAAVVATGLPRGGPARLAAAGLVGLTAWTALSMVWGESVERAWAETDRWVIYAGVLLATLAATRALPVAVRTLTTLALATGLLSVITTARMLLGEQSIFFDHRLEAPLGYVNGTAGLLLMGLWPALALAAHHRTRPGISALGIFVATLEGGLLVLTQSRAILPALVVSALFVLLLVPDRLPRLYALLVSLAGVVAMLPFTLDVYEQKQAAVNDPPTQGVVVTAGVVILLAALVAAGVWAVLLLLRHRSRALPVAKLGAGLAVLVALGGPLVAAGDPVDAVTSRWHDFKALELHESERARFTDAGGFRYDLWRIAWTDFEKHPWRGLGAGNYGLTYFKQARTTEPVRQPHSLVMQLLAETGLPGLLLLLVFVGGAGWGLVRLARSGLRDAWLVAAAGGGLATVWLVHTSVDWLHVIPGVTGMAMIGIATLCTAPTDGTRTARRPGARVLVGVLVLTALAAAGLGRHYAAVVQRDQAADLVGTNPRGAIDATSSALKIDGEDVDTYVLRAAALARLGEAQAADQTLALAIEREPSNFVLRALRGDLAARRGRLEAARSYYRQAHERNPRDAGLALLVEHPEAAVGG